MVTTHAPRGDGNKRKDDEVFRYIVSQPMPREGTETTFPNSMFENDSVTTHAP